MPHTVNGIGTHYHGRKNVEVTVGVCKSCGFHGQVSAYNTRLWFVVAFIPIIPLGRKRIVNDCPRCRRHYAIPLAQWEAQKQLSISGAAEEFRTHPTPAAAIALHENLLGFHQMTQAGELRALITEKFPADAKLHEALGRSLANLGFAADAEGYFAKAHELRPDLPDARAGMARKAIRESRPEEARALLDFMEKPGSGQLYNLGPLEALGDAYRASSRPAEALELYQILLRELPQLAQESIFRPKVEAAETALRRKTGTKAGSILPKKKFNWRRIFRRPSANDPVSGKRALIGFGIVIALVIGGFLLSNEWVRHHRKIYVVNGLAAPVTVEIVDAGSVTVRPGGNEALTVAEGDYRVRITGAVKEEAELAVHALDYAARWSDHPVWIVNPSGAAILERTIGVYSASGTPSSIDYLAGETVLRLNDVDHPFESLPERIQVDSHEHSRTLVGLEVWRDAPAKLFRFYASGKKEAEALRFAEQHLRARPDDDGLLAAYLSLRSNPAAIPAIEKLLASRLDYRPVAMHWHRTYQSMVENLPRERRLIAEYDAMLKKEPGNSALLYLRGRLSGDHAEAQRYFEKARQLDPKNPFPLFALGYDAFAAGDLTGARPLLEQACRLSPKDATFSSVFRLLQTALGENDAVKKELRAQLSREPLSGTALVELVMHLAANGHRDEAEKEIAAFERRAGRPGKDLADSLNLVREGVLYAAGDLPALKNAIDRDSSGGAAISRYHLAIEQGRLADAARPANAGPPDSTEALALFVATSLAGKTDAADAARRSAIALLEKRGTEERRAADLLRADEPPNRPELDAVILHPNEKALLCVALAQRFPAQRDDLFALARKLNVERTFPFHLIRRATGSP